MYKFIVGSNIPTPTSESLEVVHLSDGRCEKTTECTGEGCGGEEERVSPLCFSTLVPHADQVEASWKHASLSNSEEETGGDETAIVLDKTLAHGDETKAEHAQRQPHMWLELLEKDVGWNLSKNVWDEEDGEGSVVLNSGEIQVGLKTESPRVGNIDSVDEGEKVKNAETWHNMPIYPAKNFGLCGVWWALNEDTFSAAGVGGDI